MSVGPNYIVTRYDGYLINRYRFHTKGREINRKTQNNGVVVSAQTESYSTARDLTPMSGKIEYYGVIKEMIELDYYGFTKCVLFKCDWFDVTNRNNEIKVDEYASQ